MTDGFLVFGQPQIEQAEINELIAVMESGWLGTGPRVNRFESDFATYKSFPANQVAAVNSCTAALHISMVAMGLQPGDEVITTALTFCATVNAIIHAGAVPVVADVDPVTMNLDVQDLERRVTDKTRAIIPVHFAGRPCDMDSIVACAERHDLKIVEDCAHAIETEYHGRKAGTFGDFSCFSFYVTKNVITGEGGVVLANSEEAINKVKVLSLHGMSKDAWQRYSDEGYKHYAVVECGYKYNMTDLQAAIGIHQLARVERNWARRQQIWQRYQQAFASLPFVRPAEPESNTRHAYHLYTLLIDETEIGISRDQFLQQMTERNIGVGVHYLCLADHPYYQETFGWKPEDYPVASKIGEQTVSLPLSARLSDQEIDDVIESVYQILEPGQLSIRRTG